ncbi:Spc97/Spc98 family protein [Cordyceps javanica]|uniref:Spindle pole body component n=1 Tax=Cordyceps javanica TaxID=43265 RepID=A0A545UT62_9HYPO|nr:Spc97/Spc98 family protein [Cordyceps javanica]TQW03386.1 Spc97/Spc98 family protein [Cordyceps javanica]
MLHEILLSLSGHPSPLLTAELSNTDSSSSSAALSPSERQLLASAAHLSDLHVKLIKHAARITASHPSTVCRAIATAIQSVHLAALRRKVLEVEAGILRHDPDLVGAYGIVPLTAVMGEFQQWTRRLEWLWEVVQFVEAKDADGRLCWGARAIDRLRAELQSGYRDVEEAAQTLVAAAETAWLRQVSAWIFYGRLPSATGGEDFFIRAAESPDEDYVSVPGLLPAFVTPATARSMLFIGRSLNQIRARSTTLSTASDFNNTASKLQAIADLKSPLNSASFTGTIRDIRQSLSQDILEQILPLSEVMSTMQLLREFFLLGRGEFAMAITQEADERIRGRWRRAGNLVSDKEGGGSVQNVTVRSGEVSAALARAWASLSSFEQRQSDDSDALLDRARDLLRLQLVKSKPDIAAHARPGLSEAAVALLADAPFNALLFSVPVTLAMQLPPAVDMVLSPSDMQLYGCINSYLVSLRRAHIRLTDLWKLTSLRRHYPGPRGATEYARELRQRWSARSQVLRGTWTTASAAIFFLGETEAYFQTEVVAGLWRGFRAWLTGEAQQQDAHDVVGAVATADEMDISDDGADDGEAKDDGAFQRARAPATRPTTSSSSAAAAAAGAPRKDRHDQQTLASGHAVYLDTLVHRLLLTQDAYTRPLYALLVHIDHLVTHIQRLHGIFTSVDLETDAGVVDAFADLAAEEAQVLQRLRGVERSVRDAIDDVVAALERLSVDEAFLQVWEGEGAVAAQMEEDLAPPGEVYRPARVGGLNRLLVQLKFGT